MYKDVEVLEILKPKIKSALKNTNFQERGDLEQELILKILSKLPDIKTTNIPGFFDLIKQEKYMS